MPLLETQFTLANSHVPGLTGADVYYCGHVSGLCRMYVWRPDGWDTVGFTNAPVLTVWHGGYGHNPGTRACEPTAIGGLFPKLCELLHARGWVIISLDYPPCPSKENGDREHLGQAYWLEQYMCALRAVGLIKQIARPLETNRAKVVRPELSLTAQVFGVDGQGRVNTADPNLVGMSGRSHGGTLSMYGAWFPDSLFRRFEASGALSQDIFELYTSHKPAFALSAIGQLMWTNYHVDTGTNNPSGPIFQNDIHQQFMTAKGGDKWSEVPMWIKRAASPYFHLIAGHAENKTIPVYAYWGAVNADGGTALTVADNDPYTVLDDWANQRALWEPHMPIPWARMLEDAIAVYGDAARSRVVWGNNSNNPGKPNNITVPDISADASAWILQHFGK